MASSSLRNGDDALLLYSPSTARASFWNEGSSYFRFWNRSASMLDGRGQRRGGDRHVIARPVLVREGVGVGPQRLEDVVVLLLRILLGAAEHHVLEEVGEAREPLLDLVARPGADHRVVGDDPRRVERHRDHGQAVVERRLVDRVRRRSAGGSAPAGSAAGSGSARKQRQRARSADTCRLIVSVNSGSSDVEMSRLLATRIPAWAHRSRSGR